MSSSIDPTKPTTGQALTADVRQNFQHAKDEIEALQDTVTSSFANLAAFPPTGLADKIYIALDTDIAYYWDGATYVAFAAGSVSGTVMFNAAQTLTDPQKAQARANIDAARVGTSGVVFIGAMNVADLPILGLTDRAVAIANNAAWSGGTGCLVRWDGAAWRDPDQNIAATTLRYSQSSRKFFSASFLGLGSQELNDVGMTGLYDRNELSNAALRGVVTVSVTGAGIFTNTQASLNQLFDSRAGTFLQIFNCDETTTQVIIHIDMLQNLPNYGSARWQPFIQYRLGIKSGFLASFFADILCEVSPDNVNWFTAASGGWQGTDIDTTDFPNSFWFGANAQPTVPSAITDFRYIRFTLSDFRQNATWPNKAFLWISQIGLRHLLSEYTREYVSVQGDDLLGNVLYRRGATAQLGTADNFDLQLVRNGSTIATLNAAGLDAIRLFYAGQDADTRYVLQSTLTELVQDIVGAFSTDTTFIDVIYDDLTNTILWTLVDGSITEGKLDALLAAKVNGNHNHTSSQVTDFAESVDDRVATLLQAGTNVTLNYNDASNTLTITATAPAGGSDRQLQFNNAGALNGSTRLDVESDGYLGINSINTNLTSPAQNKLKIFSNNKVGKNWLTFLDESGISQEVQPRLTTVRRKRWTPANSSTTISVDSSTSLTIQGTPTSANLAVTNGHTRRSRVDFLVTVPAVNAVVGFRETVGSVWLSNNAESGGIDFWCRWGNATGGANATHRAFVGLAVNTAAATDVEPSSQVSMIGMGWDAADVNVQIFSNDATGVASKVDLGSSFPVPVTDRASAYDFFLYAKPNSTTVFYRVLNLMNGQEALGTITTDLPAVNTFLTPRAYASVGGTSSVIGMTFFGLELATVAN